jgi:SET domain-containing protein
VVGQGNVGRFLNHCCEPNLISQSVLVGHADIRLPRLAFFAATDIPPKTELTFDVPAPTLRQPHARPAPPTSKRGAPEQRTPQQYGQTTGGASRVCHCGATNCRGRLQ